MRAVVVGGGLAGLAAALELVDSGHDVTLLESRPTLGGAVQTLPAREGDPPPPPDNGQHIALGCCAEYLGFLRRVGSLDRIERVPFELSAIDERGRVSEIRSGPLGLLRYGHLPLGERLRVARVARRLARLDAMAHDDETFADVLRRLGQRQIGIDRFWDVFIRPALNIRSEEASASLGIFTVQTALFGERGADDLVLPAAPLGALHGDAAARALDEAGAEVRLRARVVEVDGEAAHLADGERVTGDSFVVALPPEEGADVLGEPKPRLADSPIVSVHLLFDRQILRPRLAALLGSDAHWVFDRGRLTGHEPEQGQYLTVVASGVPELVEVRGRALVDLMARELTARLGRAELLWSRVSREPAATFAGSPGTAAERLGPRTAFQNVARAGAWTATGWPATMESAVRSGRAAARLVQSTDREKVKT
jgi:squalene-associated FAD-dependent desaturase